MIDRSFLLLKNAFGGEVEVTTFTCDSRASLAPAPGHRLEVYQVIFSNTTAASIEGGIGGQ